MTWSDFYLICFAAGFLFSVISFILGGIHFHGHSLHVHDIHFGAHHVGHGVAGGNGAQGAHVSPFNLFSLAVFLAWFGGTGYLLSRYSTVVFALGLLLSTIVGLIGASIVFLFLARVLANPEADMNAADYEMVGVLGSICSSIRAGGTGELLYSQMGTRRVCGARSEDGTAIAKGVEVVVTRYERGIAYVRLWDEISGEDSQPRTSSQEMKS